MDILRQEVLNGIFGERVFTDNQILTLASKAMDHIEDEDAKTEFLSFLFIQQQRSPKVHDDQSRIFEELKQRE